MESDPLLGTSYYTSTYEEYCESPPPPPHSPTPPPPPEGEEDPDGELATLFCPVFHLHPREEYFPSSAEDMLAHASLWYDGGEEGSVCVLPVGGVTVETLLDPQSPHPRPTASWQWRLKGEEGAEGGEREAIASVPVYAHVVRTPEAIAITYVTMYPFNGSYAICCGLTRAGDHQADVEHLTVYLDPAGENVTHVYFAAHRMRDGVYVDRNDLSFAHGSRGKRVNAYVAKAGHGLYPSPARWCRVWGCANDLTGQGGVVWDPENIVVITETSPPWMMYRGQWGSHHDLPHGFTSGPAFQGWWAGEHPVSRSCFKRAFCQCME